MGLEHSSHSIIGSSDRWVFPAVFIAIENPYAQSN